jgi:hypothetical protein
MKTSPQKDLHSFYCSPNIISVTEDKMNGTCLIEVWEIINVYKMLVGKGKGNILLGRYNRRWKQYKNILEI